MVQSQTESYWMGQTEKNENEQEGKDMIKKSKDDITGRKTLCPDLSSSG